MRILIITQKVDIDDDILGFFHQWILEFAKHCEKVTVICLEKSAHKLPDNVRILSLGKEQKDLRFKIYDLRFFKRIKYLFNFYKYIWRERKNYDAVFVHMNTEYVVLAGWLWRLLKKRIGFWYVHKNFDFKLYIAEKFVHRIFTTSKDSFRLKSKKVYTTGHGIPVELFECPLRRQGDDIIRILHVGRITPIKNLDVLIETTRLLRDKWGKRFCITLVGEPAIESDKEYVKYIKDLMHSYKLGDVVSFTGKISHSKIKNFYYNSDLTVNLCPTGGMDKAVLESMASKTLAIVSNTAFCELFGNYASTLVYEYKNPENLALKIRNLFQKNNEELYKMREFLHERVKSHSSLKNLIPQIVSSLDGVNK